jgi:hypothetical protein
MSARSPVCSQPPGSIASVVLAGVVAIALHHRALAHLPAYCLQVIVSALPGMRSATSCGYRAAVAWNAVHIVADEPGPVIAALRAAAPRGVLR